MNKAICTILVADDDKYVRDDLAELLKSTGYSVLFSSSAKETLEKVIGNRPNLVLLDIKFPDCADLSLLKQIKTLANEVEVIILTSQADDVYLVDAAIRLGVYDYVAKPFFSSELLNRIDKALQLQHLSRQSALSH